MKPPGRQGPAAWLFLTFLGFYGLFAGGHLYTGDAETVLRTDRSLLAGAGFAIPWDRSYGGSFAANGKFYAQYGLGAVLTGLLPAALGEAISPAPASHSERLAAQFPFSLWNLPFAAGCVAMLYAILLELGYPEPVALSLAALSGVSTMLWPYAGRDFTEPQATFLLLLAFHQLLVSERRDHPRHAVAAGAALGYALLTKVYVVVLAPLFVLYACATSNRRGEAAAAVSGPLAAAALLIAGYNFHRFGSPFATGYSSEVQNTHIPLWQGAFGLLFSSGKSFFLYNPPSLLGLIGAGAFHRRHPAASRFVWALAATHLVFFGMQQNWHGDWSWGPRYLLPLAPFLLILAAPVTERALALVPGAPFCRLTWGGLFLLGIAVQLLGVAISPNDFIRYLSDQKIRLGDYLTDYKDKTYVPFHQHLWNPDFAPIRGHWHLLRSALGWKDPSFRLHSTAEEWNDETSHHLLPFVDLGPAGTHGETLDFWFVSLPPVVDRKIATRVVMPYGACTLLLTLLGIPRLARRFRVGLRDSRRALGSPGGEVLAT